MSTTLRSEVMDRTERREIGLAGGGKEGGGARVEHSAGRATCNAVFLLLGRRREERRSGGDSGLYYVTCCMPASSEQRLEIALKVHLDVLSAFISIFCQVCVHACTLGIESL